MAVFRKNKLMAAMLVSCSAIASPPVAASQAVLEEIVVTARKQEESLQSVPITVQAFTETALKNRGVENSADIGNFISNVQFDTSSSFAGAATFQAYIRGVGQSDFAINTDPAVGVYVDGVYYARAVGSVLELLDVERIEVLKGPQGTLFGRNSIGGAINVITKEPSDEASFDVQVTVGENSRQDLSLVANIPLADNLKSSLAFSTSNRDGFQRRIEFPGANTGGGGPRLDQILATDTNTSDDDELGGIGTDSFRGKLLWDVNDSFSLTFAADYTSTDTSASAITLLDAEVDLDVPGGLAGLFNLCVDGVPAPPCATSPFFAGESLNFNNQFLTGDIDTTFGNGANFNTSDDYGLSVTGEWQINENLLIKSITAYREIDQAFGVDLDSSPAIFDQTTFTIDQNQFSQEFQLTGDVGRLNYTVGAFYFDESATQADNVPIAGGLIQVSGDNSQDTESFSLFGEANFALTDSVNLVAGIRYTDEEKTLQLNQQSLNPDFFLSVGLPAIAFPRDDLTFLGPEEAQVANFDNTSVRLGVNWQINDNWYTYATFSQGFKSGGFTTRLTGPFSPEFGDLTGGLSQLDFDEETVDSFEIGFKGQLLNNRLRFNGALFFNDYEDIQIVVQRGVSPANENAGAADINGVEFEVEALLTDNINVSATLGFTDAEYTELDPLLSGTPFGAISIDNELPNTPDTTASVALNWVLPTASLPGETALNVNYSYTGEVFNDTENTELLREGASSIWNASVGWVSESEKWDVRLGVQNLTDERRLVSGFNSGALNFVAGSFNRPREWYLTVGYSY